jgi:hypothetical protein
VHSFLLAAVACQVYGFTLDISALDEADWQNLSSEKEKDRLLNSWYLSWGQLVSSASFETVGIIDR